MILYVIEYYHNGYKNWFPSTHCDSRKQMLEQLMSHLISQLGPKGSNVITEYRIAEYIRNY